tara:strand:+ start:1149 stop:2030 length:882 start_codon:yes stop_codon:yes gene_type:complete
MVVNPHGNWNTSGGSYGGGEDFGSPFGGGSPYSPPSTVSEADVPYDPGEGPRGVETDVSTVSQDPTEQALEVEKPLTEWEKIWNLAELEAGDPFDEENRYAKSFEGSEWIKRMEKSLSKTTSKTTGKLLTPDDPEWDQALRSEWTYKFGMPSMVATQRRLSGEPIKTTKRTTEYGEEIPGGEYIYSGLGKTLMDQYDQPGFDYGTAKEAYWDERAAQESIDQSQRTSWGGYDGGSGGASGTGYYGDPRTGNPIEQMANYYTPQANLQRAAVNVFSTPTVFAKRGGIVSLLRLN